MDFWGTMDEGLLLVVIGVLFIGASVIFGWMLFYLARSREKKSPSDSRQRPLPTNQAKPAPLIKEEERAEKPLRGQFAALSEVGRRASAAPVEVMHLLRDRVTGALIVEVEEKRYRALKEIKDGQVGRLVLRAAADLLHFTEVMQPQKQAGTGHSPDAEPAPTIYPPSPSTLALKIAPALEQEPAVPRTPAPPSVEQEFLQSLSQSRQPEEKEPPKTSLNPIEFFRRGFAARRTARIQNNVSARSFVDEIEDILQRFILTYPSFIGKKVHVRTGPSGGIRIQVENKFYDTPDDIPDPEIRELIKMAIQEWEKS